MKAFVSPGNSYNFCHTCISKHVLFLQLKNILNTLPVQYKSGSIFLLSWVLINHVYILINSKGCPPEHLLNQSLLSFPYWSTLFIPIQHVARFTFCWFVRYTVSCKCECTNVPTNQIQSKSTNMWSRATHAGICGIASNCPQSSNSVMVASKAQQQNLAPMSAAKWFVAW